MKAKFYQILSSITFKVYTQRGGRDGDLRSKVRGQTTEDIGQTFDSAHDRLSAFSDQLAGYFYNVL